MREVERVRSSGFCPGVARALSMLKKEAPIETLHEVVHNPEVVKGLADRGIIKRDNLSEVQGNKVAIRAHGEPPPVYHQIKKRNLRIVDTTCPIVRKAQELTQEWVGKNFGVIIFGDKNHAEVQGMLGNAGSHVIAASCAAEASEFICHHTAIACLSQTTQRPNMFWNFIRNLPLPPSLKELQAVNTVCPEVVRRQEEVAYLILKVELMVIVGGENSANTQNLAQICLDAGKKFYLIESASEVAKLCFPPDLRVGVASGTSTPSEVVDEVVERIRCGV
jgi:4-hydroxy-3-methylbut-2-enyl diphosphate reductase